MDTMITLALLPLVATDLRYFHCLTYTNNVVSATRIEVNANHVTKHRVPVRLVNEMAVEVCTSARICIINATYCSVCRCFYSYL
jgi:hypothetical protein